MIRAASIVAASLCTINSFFKYCPEIVKNTYISGLRKLGGQVVMRRASAASLHYYSAKTWVGNCPICPPIIYARLFGSSKNSNDLL